MAAHYCPCNRERARCVRYVCAREKCQCVSCHPKRAGRCKNNLSMSDVCPPFSHTVTCPSPVASVLTISSFSSPLTSPTTSPDIPLDSAHQSNLLPFSCTSSVPPCDTAAANVSFVNFAILLPLIYY